MSEFKFITNDPNAQVYKDGQLMMTAGNGGGGNPNPIPPTQPSVPANLLEIPYPYKSQLLRDKTIGEVPSGYWFRVPLNLPPHQATDKNYGFPGECFRDRMIQINGIIVADWWVSPLGIRTEDNFSVNAFVPGTTFMKGGDLVYLWFRHPNGEVFTDRFELLANR